MALGGGVRQALIWRTMYRGARHPGRRPPYSGWVVELVRIVLVRRTQKHNPSLLDFLAWAQSGIRDGGWDAAFDLAKDRRTA